MMNEESNKPVPIGERGIVLRSLEAMTQFAAMVLKSKLAPREFNDIPSVCIAIQYGLELGLTPMAALQGVAVINGKPSVYGDSALAVCYGTGLVEEFSELELPPEEYIVYAAAAIRLLYREIGRRELGRRGR